MFLKYTKFTDFYVLIFFKLSINVFQGNQTTVEKNYSSYKQVKFYTV